jgi:hypothetical protein
MCAFQPNTKAVRREQMILGHPRYAAERPVVIEFLRRLRAATTPQNYFDLHRDLFNRFKARQAHIGALKTERSEHQDRRIRLAAQTPRDVPSISAAQKEADAVAEAIEVEEALLSILRVIGDGIAWRAMDYDRAAFIVLGTGTRVGRLADDEGLDPEIAQIESFWRDGVFAIHNDLTSLLRHGDVTAIYPDGRRIVVEVKRSRVDADGKQAARLKDATEYINKRRHTFADGKIRDIVEVKGPYKTRLSHLPGLINAARAEAYAGKTLSRCQWVCVVSNRVADGDIPEAKARYERQKHDLGWADARTFSYTTIYRRMRDRKHSFPGIAPLSIYPLDVEDLADLMLGYLDVLSLLNIDVLGQQFSERGISVEFTDNDTASSNFLIASRRVGDRELFVHVDPTLREQLLAELMRPETAIASVKAVLDAVEAEPSPEAVERIASFADEASVWEARTRSS